MCQNIITQCAFIVVDEHVLCAGFLTFLMSMPPVFRRSHCDGKHKRVHQYAVWRNYAPEFDVTRARSLFSCIVADERHILTQYCDVTWTRGEITSPSIHSLPYRKICCDFFMVCSDVFLTCKTVHVECSLWMCRWSEPIIFKCQSTRQSDCHIT